VDDPSSIEAGQTADPIVEMYKRRIDRTVIRENLSKSQEERLLALEQTIATIQQLHSPGARPSTTQFQTLLAALSRNGASFVIVGGVAGTLHGAMRITYDVDVVYDRSPENLRRLVAALVPLKPYLRDGGPGLPFRLDEATLNRGLNFKFATASGAIDLMGELAGAGSFPAVRAHAIETDLFGARYSFLGLGALIAARRVAGRTKDLEAIAELEVIREEKDAPTLKPPSHAPA
jgi:hypothetical protein